MNPDEISSDFPKKGRRKASLREASSVPSRMIEYENTFYALFSCQGGGTRDPGPGFFLPQDRLEGVEDNPGLVVSKGLDNTGQMDSWIMW